jgi:hypothetical protein
MTAQFPERIRIDGTQHAMCETPLGTYFTLGGTGPSLAPTSTALWRGYVGTWEILDGRLYLVDIDARTRDGRPATLVDFFPGFPDRVFAHWYSGTLRIPQGKLLRYIHAGFASRTERDLLIEIADGVVTGQLVRINGKANPDAPEGYGVGAVTELRYPPYEPR